MPGNQENLKHKDFFLPDFCQVQSVFLVILIAELLAVLFTLLNIQPQLSLWNSLGLYSISIQIVTLVSVACLCLLRPLLADFNDWVSGIASLAIVLITTILFTLAVIRWYWWIPIDLSDQSQNHLLMRNVFISGLIGLVVLRYFYLQFQYRKQLALEASARLDALQARIRPHFLFNSMNVIASLTRIDPCKAETAIEDLSDLFRATLDNKQELIPFAEELQNAEHYLALEKLRLEERLIIEKQVEAAALDVMIPPLSVQPLLENAIYHGIQMLPEGGRIGIDATIKSKELIISVTNPKPSLSNQKGLNQNGNGIALANISQRLEVIYSGKAHLTCDSSGDFHRVVMQIPLQKSTL